MSNRIIKCQVANEFIKGAGRVIGAAGSHDDVELELDFSPMWDGTSKRIVWFDALGENPVLSVLTTNLLVPGTSNIYRVPVPPEAKAVEGNMLLTIRGAEVKDGKETRAVVAATATFTVLPAVWDPFAEEALDVSPSQADQLQAQIEDIKVDIVRAAQASDALAQTQAERARAEEARNASEAYAGQSAGYMTEAMNQANIAGSHASRALQAANDAEKSVDDAKDFSKTAAQQAAAAAAAEVEKAKSEADRAQSEAERATVPAVKGVYNLIIEDRAAGERYVLLVENGIICLLGTDTDAEATDMSLIDTQTGMVFVLGIENGIPFIEEVI